jgi:hypothetical protein
MPGHSAVIIKNPMGNRNTGPKLPMPKWHKEWLANQGKWVELSCGCIADINLPSAVLLLTKKPEIFCDKCDGFMQIKESLSFREVIRRRLGIQMPDSEGLFPPF